MSTIHDDLGLETEAEVGIKVDEPKAKAAGKKSAKKRETAAETQARLRKEIKDELLQDLLSDPKLREVIQAPIEVDETPDMSLVKKGYIPIIIDEVPGMNNFEVVGVNGIAYQIKRGVPVPVPPEVIHVLENAVATHIEQKFDRRTGEYVEVIHHSSAIPWRRA